MATFNRTSMWGAALSMAALGYSSFDRLMPRMRLPKRRHWHKPHQGHRERARRIGGETCAAHKAGDRARRGLPAEG